MEDTVRFLGFENPNTVPLICENNQIQLKKLSLRSGMNIRGYILHSPIAKTESSEVWYCNDEYETSGVIKFTTEFPDEGAFQEVREIYSDYLVPIRDCGYYGEFWFEVYDFYRNGSLDGQVIDAETLRTVVLPGIIAALEDLHQRGLIHNDIKPSNLYWDDDMGKVLLGDYGSVKRMKEKPTHLTPAYAAPELLQGYPCGRASDWGSVGLTLATLVSGVRLIPANTIQEAFFCWERELVVNCEDYTLKQLIRGMIQHTPQRRLGPKAAKQWCGNETFGGEARTAVSREKKVNIITIPFHNPPMVAADIDTLLQGIEGHWDESIFLFGQSKLDRFLSQFDNRWVQRCREIRKKTGTEDALYRLTLELEDFHGYVWRGKHYTKLIDMEDTWESGEQGELDITTFLQKGHATYFLQHASATPEQIKMANDLQNTSKISPYEACGQFFQALRGNNGLYWDGENFKDLINLTDWLEDRTDILDQEIDRFFDSKKFSAWFAFQGMSDVLDEIRRKSER